MRNLEKLRNRFNGLLFGGNLVVVAETVETVPINPGRVLPTGLKPRCEWEKKAKFVTTL
jgi:hypothetical protein